MATGNVTISTFLELRDNLSGGIKSVESQINRLTDAAKKAEDAIKRMKQAQAGRGPRAPSALDAGGAGGAGAGGRGGGRGVGAGAGAFAMAEAVPWIMAAELAADAIMSSVRMATDAVKDLLKYTVKVGMEYEDTQLQITNTLASLGVVASLESGQRRSLALMGQMRELAAALPGEAKDYINAFSLSLPDALAAGQTDLKKYADAVSKYMSVTFKAVDAPQAARDLVEMLQGRVGGTKTKTFSMLQAQIGMTAKAFNALTRERRFEVLMAAVEKRGVGMSLAAETASAKFGELKSRLEEIVFLGGQPFFESAKQAVTMLNTFLSENKTTIVELSKLISKYLGSALEGTLYYLLKILKAFDSIATTVSAKFDAVEKTFVSMLGSLKATVTNPAFRLIWEAHEKVIGSVIGMGRELEATRAQEKEEAQLKRREDIMKRYGFLEARLPSPGVGIEEYKEAMKSLYTLRTPTGKSIFDTPADWQAFVEAQGRLTPEAVDRLYAEMVQSGVAELNLPKPPATGRELTVNFNNNRFDIRQAFAEGFDPDRIAVAFASDLGRLGEFQMQSALAPYASVQ